MSIGLGKLLHSPAKIVQALMIAAAQGSDPLVNNPQLPWPIYATNEPTSFDDIIWIADTAGKLDGRSMPTGHMFKHWGINVSLRATDHDAGWAYMSNLEAWMVGDGNQNPGINQAEIQVINKQGTGTYLVWCFSGVQLIEVHGTQSPKTKRSFFSLNATVPIRQVA